MSTDLASTIPAPALRATGSTTEHCPDCGHRRRIEIGTDGEGHLIESRLPCAHCNGEASRVAKRMVSGTKLWPKAEMILRGAELFLQHPEASSAMIHAMLEREADGRRLCTLMTWQMSWAPKARRLAGVDGGAARTAALKRGREEARGNGGGQGPGRGVAARPPAPTPGAGTTHPGRSIDEEAWDTDLILPTGRIRGRRLAGMRWHIEFSGEVDGRLAADLVVEIAVPAITEMARLDARRALLGECIDALGRLIR